MSGINFYWRKMKLWLWARGAHRHSWYYVTIYCIPFKSLQIHSFHSQISLSIRSLFFSHFKLSFRCTRFILIKCLNKFHYWRQQWLHIHSPTTRRIAQLTHKFNCLFVNCSFFFCFFSQAKWCRHCSQLLLSVFSLLTLTDLFHFFSICGSCFNGTLLFGARAHKFISSSAIITMSYMNDLRQKKRKRKKEKLTLQNMCEQLGKQMTNIK